MKTLLLSLLTTVCVMAAPAAAPCCPETPQVKKEGCCEELAGPPYTKRSLYQADASFVTDADTIFKLGTLRGRPVVLTMFFASCGYACPLIVGDMQAIRAKLPPEIRDRAAFVLISFDSARDTPAVLARYRAQRALDSSWILLHGNDDAVRELAALLGVKFKQEADGAFSHANLITILNDQGEITHQRLGLKGGLDETASAMAGVGGTP